MPRYAKMTETRSGYPGDPEAVGEAWSDWTHSLNQATEQSLNIFEHQPFFCSKRSNDTNKQIHMIFVSCRHCSFCILLARTASIYPTRCASEDPRKVFRSPWFFRTECTGFRWCRQRISMHILKQARQQQCWDKVANEQENKMCQNVRTPSRRSRSLSLSVSIAILTYQMMFLDTPVQPFSGGHQPSQAHHDAKGCPGDVDGNHFGVFQRMLCQLPKQHVHINKRITWTMIQSIALRK